MSRRKLTDEGIARIRTVELARRAIPTRRQLATELGISKTLVDRYATKSHVKPNVPRETSARTTKLHKAPVELGLAKP